MSCTCALRRKTSISARAPCHPMHACGISGGRSMPGFICTSAMQMQDRSAKALPSCPTQVLQHCARAPMQHGATKPPSLYGVVHAHIYLTPSITLEAVALRRSTCQHVLCPTCPENQDRKHMTGPCKQGPLSLTGDQHRALQSSCWHVRTAPGSSTTVNSDTSASSVTPLHFIAL